MINWQYWYEIASICSAYVSVSLSMINENLLKISFKYPLIEIESLYFESNKHE